MCELCDINNKKEGKIYFENEEVLIIAINDNLTVGMLKSHNGEATDGKMSGLLKLTMSCVSRNNPNGSYSIRKADDFKDHIGFYITIKKE